MIRVWHPLRDPNHCSFRIILITTIVGARRISIPKLSLMDLYVLFPEYLQQFSFHNMADQRVELRALGLRKPRESYENLPDIRTVYRELETYQRVALSRLAAKGLLLREPFAEGEAVLASERLPSSLKLVVGRATDRYREQIQFMLRVFANLGVDGTNGIFRRAGIDVPGRLR
ncbi:ABC-three component system middle component 5 [Devosia sp.]|uniref:ABC-three component system middle component 5 n=1 Tax=Devosia sp. TaxID=1871048 RepID=UPI003F6FC888